MTEVPANYELSNQFGSSITGICDKCKGTSHACTLRKGYLLCPRCLVSVENPPAPPAKRVIRLMSPWRKMVEWLKGGPTRNTGPGSHSSTRRPLTSEFGHILDRPATLRGRVSRSSNLANGVTSTVIHFGIDEPRAKELVQGELVEVRVIGRGEQ